MSRTTGSIQLTIALSLLDRVTSDLRAVVATISEAKVRATFIYDRPVDDGLSALVSEAETYALADLWPEFDVDFRPHFLPSSHSLEPEMDVRRGDVWVFRRYERDWPRSAAGRLT